MSTASGFTVHTLATPPDLGRLLAQAALPSRSRRAHLSDDQLVVDGVAIDRTHLADYARVCGFPLRDEVPITFPHVLAFPMAIALMAAPTFPFALPGLVHVANRIVRRRAIYADEALLIAVHTADLRPHPKGRQFDVVARVSVDGDEVWQSTSTYLKIGEGGADGREVRPDVDGVTPAGVWEVPADIGRRYAAVSGDRNPIHLSRLTARAFGFPRPIAHGMWSKARALAGVDERTPDAAEVTARFVTPISLPSRVEVADHLAEDRIAVRLTNPHTGAPHLEVVVRPGDRGAPPRRQ